MTIDSALEMVEGFEMKQKIIITFHARYILHVINLSVAANMDSISFKSRKFVDCSPLYAYQKRKGTAIKIKKVETGVMAELLQLNYTKSVLYV